MEAAEAFEAKRPRLVGLARGVLAELAEVEDALQQAGARLHGTDAKVASLRARLTTATTRLRLDPVRARTPVSDGTAADEVALANTVGLALQVDLHPHLARDEQRSLDRTHGVLAQACSPLGGGSGLFGLPPLAGPTRRLDVLPA